MGRLVGIDLGTTNSVVAIVDGPQPRILDNRENKPQTRSIVGVKRRRGRDDGDSPLQILVGDPAMDNWALAPEDTIVSVKRLMGRGVDDREVKQVQEAVSYRIVEPSDGTRESVRVLLAGIEHSPVDISALILKKLKEDAEYRLGEEVSHAVITVPAYFSQIQRSATRAAGQKAGLHVLKILEEPAAAAIAYGLDADDADEARTILVFDLGGGTFDISILAMAAGTFATLNLEGDMWLGGDDFDEVLVRHALDWVATEYGQTDLNTRFLVELKKTAQRVKEQLSATESADLIVAGLLQHEGHLIDVELEVTRDEYEKMIGPLVDRTTALVEKALRNASLTPDQVDHVLMAGNASSVPLVQRTMEDMFGKDRILRRVHPKHSVAMGAAIVAAWLGPRVVCGAPDPDDPARECGHVNEAGAEVCARCGAPLVGDAAAEELPGQIVAARTVSDLILGAPFTYGAQTAGDTFTVFVQKGDPYPTESPKTEVFSTRAPNARMFSIPIFGGDDLQRASNNERQGVAFAILPPGLPQHTPVRVKLWLDGDGVFRLAASLEDGTDLQPWVVEKGEAQDRAITELDDVERLMAERAVLASPQLLAGVEEVRTRVFDRLRSGEFAGALEEVGRLRALVQRAGREDEETLEAKAERLIGWTTSIILERYRWALTASGAERLTELVQRTREDLARGDADALESSVARLDEATDDLPEELVFLIMLRGAITSRVYPHDPRAARALLDQLEAVEAGVSRQDETVVVELEALVSGIVAAMPEPPGGFRCSKGHLVPAGVRYCPECGEDRLVLAGPKGAGTVAVS